METVLLCEGSTDYTLLQYYFRNVLGWQDYSSSWFRMEGQRSRKLKRAEQMLTIAATGGCVRIPEGLATLLDRNSNSQPNQSDAVKKIVIVTDRDEDGTEASVIQKIEEVFNTFSVGFEEIQNNHWTSCTVKNSYGYDVPFQLLLMVVPFETNGAMETFLLEAICRDDPYDKEIIGKCREFVDAADPEKKYLTKRRYITKAKFDAYFTIRTAADQFAERQNILRNVPWENYTAIQNSFSLFGEI